MQDSLVESIEGIPFYSTWPLYKGVLYNYILLFITQLFKSSQVRFMYFFLNFLLLLLYQAKSHTMVVLIF